VQTWTLIRFLHLCAVAFFVGGQLMLVAVVIPALRRTGGNEVATRAIARRFGAGSGVALAVLLATGAAMASHYGLWSDSLLRAKLMLLVLVAVLTGLHIASPTTRSVSYAVVVASFVIVYLGLKLSYG